MKIVVERVLYGGLGWWKKFVVVVEMVMKVAAWRRKRVKKI